VKKSKWSEEQIVRILAEADAGGGSVQELCRRHGISEATFYNWRRRFRGMGVREARRLRDLEREVGRLKKLLAERDLQVDALEELLQKKW